MPDALSRLAMPSNALARLAALGAGVGALASLSLACCYFPGPPAPSSTTPVVPVTTPPLPDESAARALLPIAAPLAAGVERPLAGRQLTVDLPAGAPPGAPVDLAQGIGATILEYQLDLEDGAVIMLRDLPCVAEPTLAQGAERELVRRHPQLMGRLTVREMPVRDPTLSVIELIPNEPSSIDGETALAWFVIDLGAHLLLASVHGGQMGRDEARLLAESILGTLRRGEWIWTTHLRRGRTMGDLYQSIALPEGWALASSGCCNEEPPYRTHLRETARPLRPLGGPARARITARSGSCPSGTPSRPGTMFGAPMIWSRTATGLCWVERAPDGGDDLGVAWHVRGATEADLAEALTIAATASHDH